MVKQTIQIFARVKPTKAKTGAYELDVKDDGVSQLSFFLPKELAGGLVNNKKENYKFRFEKVFDQNAKQEDIFESVAKPVIDNVVSGYNGTIFAYGQTGSGKTFTITGGAEKYSQRGIIPRTLGYIYELYEKMPEREFSCNVSYLEIYNNSGYDLLDPKHEAAKLEDLPKVSLVEDEGQNIHLKNLSIHPAGNEEDALNLLFLGDTNRMIAETPMNQASTRSHCIFTIHLMSKEVGSATVRRSKLHLVDLAGSERVSKTGVNGVLLAEAKYINLSLHFLEQVIVALGEKTRTHVPYRNSMMTSVLRDSLGGNCMTTMIATCSVERKNIDESISTCRFAQRVAMIKNDALLNEEMDPRLMVEKLKRDIVLLKEELAMATGEQRTDALSQEEIDRCERAVDIYLQDSDPDALLDIGADMRKIQMCYKIIKTKLLSRPKEAPPPPAEIEPEVTHYDKMELKKLQDLLLQRDNEINILVNMLKKEKKRLAGESSHHGSSRHSAGQSARHHPSIPEHESKHHRAGGQHETQQATHGDTNRSSARGRRSVAASIASSTSINSHRSESERVPHHRLQPDNSSEDLTNHSSTHRPYSSRRQKAVSSKQILGDMSIGRQQAFEIFKRDYHENSTIEQNKADLRQKYAEAKQLGEQVNKDRNVINKTKSQLEHHRVQKAMQGDESGGRMDDTESDLKDAMEQAKRGYKEKFAHLRTLKSEIEHLQHYLERSKVKLMKDFEYWWAEQMNNNTEAHLPANHQPSQDIKSAWRTPPPSGGSTKTGDGRPMRANHVPPLELRDSGNSATFIKHSTDSRHQPTHDSYSNSSINSLSTASLQSTKHASSNGHHSTYTPNQTAYRAAQRAPAQGAPVTSDTSLSRAPDIPLTGDAEADADIMAFLKARQNAMQLSQARQKT